MKFVFLIGGFLGFVTTVSTGLLADRSMSLVLRDSAIGCLAGAFLFKWFWSVLVSAMREAAQARAQKLAELSSSPSRN